MTYLVWSGEEEKVIRLRWVLFTVGRKWRKVTLNSRVFRFHAHFRVREQQDRARQGRVWLVLFWPSLREGERWRDAKWRQSDGWFLFRFLSLFPSYTRYLRTQQSCFLLTLFANVGLRMNASRNEIYKLAMICHWSCRHFNCVYSFCVLPDANRGLQST